YLKFKCYYLYRLYICSKQRINVD
ncbi:hypothetical protein VCNHCC008D_002351B, partial [Vibrio cholerae O1 str. NHCC-008D]